MSDSEVKASLKLLLRSKIEPYSSERFPMPLMYRLAGPDWLPHLARAIM
jgi:hypothetical protein